MQQISIRSKYRPIHFYNDQTFYFLTFRTINKIKYFNTDEKKCTILGVIRKAQEKFNSKFFAWVILDNHLHLLIHFLKGSFLPRFTHNISANISRVINKIDFTPNRKLFNNYWDSCIRNETDFWKHFNYIHNNPIKHGYVKNFEELINYPFSSFNTWRKKNGQDGFGNVLRVIR